MNFHRNAVGIAIVVAVAGLGGCASWHHGARDDTVASGMHRGPVQTTEDAAITAKVKTKMAADEVVKARHIDVDTVRGVVQLNGTVNSADEKSRALQIARSCEGVVDVRDNLKVQG